MTKGELDPMNALMSGKIKVTGNMAAILKHAEGSSGHSRSSRPSRLRSTERGSGSRARGAFFPCYGSTLRLRKKDPSPF